MHLGFHIFVDYWLKIALSNHDQNQDYDTPRVIPAKNFQQPISFAVGATELLVHQKSTPCLYRFF